MPHLIVLIDTILATPMQKQKDKNIKKENKRKEKTKEEVMNYRGTGKKQVIAWKGQVTGETHIQEEI